ncbi:MAG: hypothetical protein M1826_003605 [Phylliscum demangeonii]|nr:MAG: hypothetical protein M1826_003605 [Phylliscum demangeonii]
MVKKQEADEAEKAAAKEKDETALVLCLCFFSALTAAASATALDPAAQYAWTGRDGTAIPDALLVEVDGMVVVVAAGEFELRTQNRTRTGDGQDERGAKSTEDKGAWTSYRAAGNGSRRILVMTMGAWRSGALGRRRFAVP